MDTQAQSQAQPHLTIIGWIIALLLLYWWSKTKLGHTLIYYGLVLIFVFVLLDNYQRLNDVIFTKQQN